MAVESNSFQARPIAGNEALGTSCEIPNLRLQEILDRYAAESPDAIALIFGSDELSYAEMVVRANRLSRHLMALGVVEGSRVGLEMPRGIDAVIAMIAILKCGAAWVPMESEWPERRRNHIFDDAELILVITPLFMTEAENAVSALPDYSPESRAEASSAAYVIYTSGSTGVPKGVEVAHRSVVDLVLNAEYATFDATTRFLHVFSLTSDVSVMEIWTPLLHGGTLVIAPPEQLSCSALKTVITNQAVTDGVLPSAWFHQQVRAEPLTFNGMRSLMVGVESLRPDLAEVVMATSPNLRLVHGYGPTETTVYSIYHVVTPEDTGSEQLPIGLPRPNAYASILDACGLPVSGQEVGELYLGGPGVAIGYVNAPESASRFISDHYAPGQRLYRTGDLAHWNDQGAICFNGRIDRQFKVRGYRIEPAEIERAAESISGVTSAYVSLHESVYGEQQIVVHCAVAPSAAIDAGALRSRLADILPSHMVPSHCVTVDALPLTTTGKVDPAALPAVGVPHATSLIPHDGEKSDAVSAEVARLWVEHLGLADPDATFAEAGGSSLTAMRLIAQIEHNFGVRIQLSQLIENGTLSALTAAILSNTTTTAESSTPVLAVHRENGTVPATAAQRALWVHQQRFPHSAVYNEVMALRVRGRLDEAALQNALNQVAARHEALRSSLHLVEDRLELRVAHDLTFPFRAMDVAADALSTVVRALAREPFDLECGPVVRAHLLRLGLNEYVLLLSSHHAFMDGWSADLLFSDLQRYYSAQLSGVQANDDQPTQFSDVARWQHELHMGGHFDPHMDYWQETLSGRPANCGLPLDRPRPAQPSGNGALACSRLSQELVERVDSTAKGCGVTRFAVLMAALHLLISRYAGTDDVTIGTGSSGRDEAASFSAVGFLTNTVLVRSQIDASDSFHTLLTKIRTQLAGAYAHQRLPYATLASAMGTSSEMNAPFLQVLLVPEDVYRHEFNLGDTSVRFEYFDIGISKFDLTIFVAPDGNSLQLLAEYDSDIFNPDTIARALANLTTLLDAAVARPDTPVSELPIMTAEESALVIGGFDGPVTTEELRLLHAQVEAWAELTPNAPAVRCAGKSLSYIELSEGANRLANYLGDQGVTPGDRVAVALPRGIETIVAFLAVLKAGATYVPVDPAYPEARRQMILEDAAPVYEISQATFGRDAAVVAMSPSEAPFVSTSLDHPVYVMYTSGSTGTPKGMEITHRNVADMLVGVRHVGLSTEPGHGRHLHTSATAFDMSTHEIWVPLTSGGCVIVAPPPLMTAEQARELIARQGITHAFLPTALFHRWTADDPECLSGLETLIVGGEVLDCDRVVNVMRSAPGLRFVHAYGPTEATVCSTYHILNGIEQATAPLPIGRPTANTVLRVLGAGGEVQPIGVVGELCIGGPGLTRGYLGRPGVTADRFVADDADPTLRLYRTGDLAKWNADGTITFCGRDDDQVKLNGFRVELGEVEAALRTHPFVVDVCAVKRVEGNDPAYLVAYYTGTVEVSPLELADLAASVLPAHMTPRIFVRIPAIPLNGNGKVDRAALPEPQFNSLPEVGVPAVGWSTTEERMAAVWRAVLHAQVVGLDETLFDIGGGSLHVTRIHLQVVKEFDVSNLRLVDLFAHPTIRTLARFVDSLRSANTAEQSAKKGSSS
ncbi:amino acid adenylation domain-containing protein [Streptomyces sp. NPDC087908]|uniref:amino acid adenylation domain-containing protein n=1 Tax=Streptomyces sp. NPDC087908 TaxID=3365820 RepID=UPI0037FF5306